MASFTLGNVHFFLRRSGGRGSYALIGYVVLPATGSFPPGLLFGYRILYSRPVHPVFNAPLLGLPYTATCVRFPVGIRVPGDARTRSVRWLETSAAGVAFRVLAAVPVTHSGVAPAPYLFDRQC